MLARTILFLKTMKEQDRLSQNWCKGQLVLFSQDVIEVAEQLPLPLHNAPLVFTAESRESQQQHLSLIHI